MLCWTWVEVLCPVDENLEVDNDCEPSVALTTNRSKTQDNTYAYYSD